MPILIPVCNSSSPTFLMVCSAYRLKKLGDNRQPCHTPLSILNQSVVQHRVLTVVSWPTYRFLREQVIRWSDIRNTLRAFQFVIIHTVKGFSVVDEIEVDVFLESLCFLYDSANVGNFIFVSSSFSKLSLDIWKFLVRIMLKSTMHDFKHDLASMEDECNCLILSTYFSTPLLGDLDEYWPFPVLWPLPGLPDSWHIEYNTLMTSFFRVLNSSAGIPLCPLALLTTVLPKALMAESEE